MTEQDWLDLEAHPKVTIAANGSWLGAEQSTGGGSDG